MAQDEIRHPALTGAPWPVIGVRVRHEDRRPRAASWCPAPLAVPRDVLLPCAWPELEGLAKIAVGLSRARVYVRDLAEDEPDGRLVLCLRGALGAIQVQGPLAPVADVLAARTRAAMLRVAAVPGGQGRNMMKDSTAVGTAIVSPAIMGAAERLIHPWSATTVPRMNASGPTYVITSVEVMSSILSQGADFEAPLTSPARHRAVCCWPPRPYPASAPGRDPAGLHSALARPYQRLFARAPGDGASSPRCARLLRRSSPRP